MGQSKLQEGRSLDAPLDIYQLNDDGSQESIGFLTFPIQRHLKGRSRLAQIEGRAGSIIALIMNPHQPEVLNEVRKVYTTEGQQIYIPAIQQLGRDLRKSDWYARVDCEEVGLPQYEAMMFYSSEAVAERLGMGEKLQAIAHEKLVRMAVKAGHTID